MPAKRLLAFPAAALVLAAAVVPARAFLWWRSRLESRWAARPVAVDGDDSGWDDSAAYENSGLSLQAMNDGSSLWLLATARTETGREQLTGAARQDLTVWFLAPGGKTAQWGVLLPFREQGEDAEPSYAAAPGGGAGNLPEGFSSKRAAIGRRPVWEMRLPLSSVTPDADGRLAVDFAVTGEAARRARRARPRRAESRAEGGERGEAGEAGEAGEGRGRMGRRGGGPGRPQGPEPLRLSLSVSLARAPRRRR